MVKWGLVIERGCARLDRGDKAGEATGDDDRDHDVTELPATQSVAQKKNRLGAPRNEPRTQR